MNTRKNIDAATTTQNKDISSAAGMKYSKELKRIMRSLKKHTHSSFQLGSMDLQKASSLRLKLKTAHDLVTRRMLNLIQLEQLF